MTKAAKAAKAFDKFFKATQAKVRLDREIICPCCEMELRKARMQFEVGSFSSHVDACLGEANEARDMTKYEIAYFDKQDELWQRIANRAPRFR